MISIDNAPLRSQRIGRCERCGIRSVSRQVTPIVEGAPCLRCCCRAVQIVSRHNAELRLPLRSGQGGILGAKKPAKGGNSGTLESFVAVVSCPFITPAHLVKKYAVNPAVNLYLA